MAKVNQITDLIGNTPLVKINKLNDLAYRRIHLQTSRQFRRNTLRVSRSR